MWRPTQYTDAVGEPTLWQPEERADNDAPIDAWMARQKKSSERHIQTNVPLPDRVERERACRVDRRRCHSRDDGEREREGPTGVIGNGLFREDVYEAALCVNDP
jgi:hypothetical protein